MAKYRNDKIVCVYQFGLGFSAYCMCGETLVEDVNKAKTAYSYASIHNAKMHNNQYRIRKYYTS
jgi:hypothetical protein